MGKDLEQLFSNIFLPQFNQRVEYHSLSDKYLVLTHTAAEKCIWKAGVMILPLLHPLTPKSLPLSIPDVEVAVK